MAVKEHKHVFHRWGYTSGKETIFHQRCKVCGEKRDRKASAKEHKRIQAKIKDRRENIKKIHAVVHKFRRHFGSGIDKWKYKGYDLMTRIEKYVKRNPAIKIVRCDDNFFASSMIVLIPHESPKEYWGTSMLFVPQCTGEEPISMFLYPNHREDLVAVLRTCTKRRSK